MSLLSLRYKYICRFAANVVLLSSYGYRVLESSDPVLARIEEGIHLSERNLGILGFLLDTFPMCL